MLYFDPDTDSDLILYCYITHGRDSGIMEISSGKSLAIKSLYSILWHSMPRQAVKKFYRNLLPTF